MDQTLKILVIRFSSIGDIVLTTPIIRCLKQQLPQAEIHFLIKKNFYSVIRNNPNIDKVYFYTGSFHQTLKELQEEKYNYIIDLQNNIRSNRFKRRLNVQSFTVNKINFKKWLYVTFKLNFLPQKHIVDRYFDTVQTLNVFNDGRGLEFYSTNEADEVLTFLDDNFRKGYLLFVVGAAHNTKQIPQNKAIEIINGAGKPVVLVGGESDRAKAEELCRELTVEYYNFTGKTTLEQTAVLIREAKVVITPDTGAMHIAAAYNKPIVSLWGNTVPEFGMYPYMPESNNRYYLAEVKLPCRPCTKIGYNRCPLGHFNCMQKQNIEAILSKIKEFWEIEQAMIKTYDGVLLNGPVQRGDIELMVPAGDFEALSAAIQGGANSVYFGVGRLNMRAKSSINFTIEDLPEIVARCKPFNVQTYLTLNTVIYDSDIEEMKQLVDAAYDAGISAIIATDIATLRYASQKGMEIHASTQLNISNVEALKFYAQWIDVGVLARELTLNQVAFITRQIKEQNIVGPSGNLVRIEIFAHGALCMAISGKCYLSLHETGASANRGACQQTCRKSYIVTEKETGHELEVDNEYIMSPKDLCTIGFLNKIIDAGVRVLKIEGRARGPEYVKKVCQVYNQALDSLVDGTYSEEKIRLWKTELSKVFNRGFWDGYYLGKRLGEWSSVYGSIATHTKTYVGKITNYFTKISVIELKIEATDIEVGQTALIIGPTTGVYEFEIKEIRIDDQSVKKATQGQIVSIPVDELVRRGDKFYIFKPNETIKIY